MLPFRPSMRLLPVTIAALVLLLGAKCIDLIHAVAFPHFMMSTAVVPTARAAPATAKQTTPPAPVAVAIANDKPELPVSDAERALLQDLRARRIELDRRDAAVGLREQSLEAIQKRLSARLGELSSLQTRLEELDAVRLQHDDANWRGLVKLYEVMKPRDAAAIFNDMDQAVLLQVLDRMKDSKASLVLAAMLPDRARLATAQLAALRTQSVTVPHSAPAF